MADATPLQRFVDFLSSFSTNVQTGLQVLVSAVSPGRKRPRPHSHTFDPSSAPSPPSFADPLASHRSASAPDFYRPSPKRRRISLTSSAPSPAPAAAAAAASNPSPFARAPQFRFGRLPHPHPSSPLNSAVGLTSALHTPIRPPSPVPPPAPPPLAPLDLSAVFRYASTPRPRPTPNRSAMRRPLFRQQTDAKPFFITSQRPSADTTTTPSAPPPLPPTPATVRRPLLQTPAPAVVHARRSSLPPLGLRTTPISPVQRQPIPRSDRKLQRRPPVAQTPTYRKPLGKQRSSVPPKTNLNVMFKRQTQKLLTKHTALQLVDAKSREDEETRAERERLLQKRIKARQARNIFKEHAGLDTRDVKENFPPELVELMQDNPNIAMKIFKRHGPEIAKVVEAEVRKRELDYAIRKEEEQRVRLKAKAEVSKRASSLRMSAFELVIGKSLDQPEQPPKNAPHFTEDYWSDDEDWDENMDDEAKAERQSKVTVTDEKSAYAPLTDIALKRVRKEMSGAEYNSMELAQVNGCVITGPDFSRLRPAVWLNDEVVNAYMELLGRRNEEQRNESDKENPSTGSKSRAVPKVKIMNSFFYSKLVQFNKAKRCSVYDYSRVRRWTKRFDAFSYDLMLIPINQGNTHWTLGVVNFKEKWVQHLDSMGAGGSGKVREHLLAWVRDEAVDKNKEFNQCEWTMPSRDVPKQKNSDDCGVFLCKFADFLSRGWVDFTFSQEHMNYFRGRIAHELLMERAT